MKKVTIVKPYFGGDGYVHPGQVLEVSAEHEKALLESGHIESEAEEKEDKQEVKTKEDKTIKNTK